MSVTEAFTLPAQPSSGTVEYVPLGGDGKVAPFAAYNIIDAAVTGDASGGFARVRVTMDDRFASLVAYVNGSIAQGAAANANFRWSVSGGAGAINVPILVEGGVITTSGGTISANSIDHIWTPPGVIVPGRCQAILEMAFENVNGDVFKLNTTIYLFDIRVRELSPIGGLLHARGPTGTNS